MNMQKIVLVVYLVFLYKYGIYVYLKKKSLVFRFALFEFCNKGNKCRWCRIIHEFD